MLLPPRHILPHVLSYWQQRSAVEEKDVAGVGEALRSLKVSEPDGFQHLQTHQERLAAMFKTVMMAVQRSGDEDPS